MRPISNRWRVPPRHGTTEEDDMYGYTPDKANYLARLRRIAWQSIREEL